MNGDAGGLEARLDALSPRRRALFEALRAERWAVPAHRPPSGDIERVLCQAWQEVLQLPAPGVDDDFFELGGDSITAVLIVARAEQAGVVFTTRDLFDARTISALALCCRRSQPEPDRPLTYEGQDTRRYPLTPLQRTILAHTYGGVAYVTQLAAELTGELSLAAMRMAWQTVTERHQALRVFVTTAGPTWQQGIAEQVEAHVDYADLRADPDHSAALAALRTAQCKPFMLDTAPLARVVLARTGDRHWWLLWTHSHLILDGWSEQIVADEVLRLVSGEVTAQELPAPDTLAPRLSASATGEDPGALELWRHRLTGATASLVGGAGPSPGRAPQSSRAVRLSEQAGSDLYRLAAACGTTIAGCLLAAWAAIIAQATGRRDVLAGVTVNGRDTAATRAVGMFACTLPLRAQVDASLPFGPWARGLQERQLDWTAGPPLGLSSIQAAAGLPRGVPMFDAMIVVQNFPAPVLPGARYGALTVQQVQADVDERVPLLLDVSIRDRIVLTLRWDPERISSADIDGWLSWLASVPHQLTASTTLASLLSGIAASRHRAADLAAQSAAHSVGRAKRRRAGR